MRSRRCVARATATKCAALLALSCRALVDPARDSASGASGRARGADQTRLTSEPRDRGRPAPARAPLELAGDGRRRRSTGHEGRRASDAARCTRAVTVIPGLPRFHARAEHGRGVRAAERGGFPVQAGGHASASPIARARRDRHLRRAARPHERAARRAGAGPRRRGRQPDRPRRAGYVSISSTSTGGSAHFWAFNVADAAITVGATSSSSTCSASDRHASHTV